LLAYLEEWVLQRRKHTPIFHAHLRVQEDVIPVKVHVLQVAENAPSTAKTPFALLNFAILYVAKHLDIGPRPGLPRVNFIASPLIAPRFANSAIKRKLTLKYRRVRAR